MFVYRFTKASGFTFYESLGLCNYLDITFDNYLKQIFDKSKTDTSDTSIGGVRSVTEGLFFTTLTYTLPGCKSVLSLISLTYLSLTLFQSVKERYVKILKEDVKMLGCQ